MCSGGKPTNRIQGLYKSLEEGYFLLLFKTYSNIVLKSAVRAALKSNRNLFLQCMAGPKRIPSNRNFSSESGTFTRHFSEVREDVGVRKIDLCACRRVGFGIFDHRGTVEYARL